MMAVHNIDITVKTNAQTFQEVNEQLSRLKVVIGVLLAKLPPNERNKVIDDLKGFALYEEADLLAQFNPKES
ncbi:hypothetical protein ACFC2F_03335 [Enterobacter sichuanensis]|uniref:hypothetical protein n=1 Tax=Enterobacter TaxID=547 RepID=UPI000F8891F0|nr:hypothetical protein [Enterobacter sp. WCHEn090032]RTN95718.1 hypothetical protein EKN83_12665 [Enterobacter sp. WCHEn090032]